MKQIPQSWITSCIYLFVYLVATTQSEMAEMEGFCQSVCASLQDKYRFILQQLHIQNQRNKAASQKKGNQRKISAYDNYEQESLRSWLSLNVEAQNDRVGAERQPCWRFRTADT